MRLAFHRQMAPRGAHPPDATFLKVHPSTISYQNHLLSYWSNQFSKQIVQTQSSQQNTKICSSSNLSSDHLSSKNIKTDSSKIPSTSDTKHLSVPVPEITSSQTLDTTGYHTVLRKKPD